MKVGEYNITPIVHGTFGLDGGAMFGIVPKPLWEKRIPADNRNRITLATRSLLIQGHGRKILVDTGMGMDWDDKFREIYTISESAGPGAALGDTGVGPGEITDVILTHLHFDHAGGAVRAQGGEPVPAFPNATYYVQAEHWKWANDPSEKDAGSFRRDRFLPLEEHGVLELIRGSEELFPGIDLQLVHGHTPFQQLPLIRGGEQPVFFCGDLIPTHAHVSIPWVMGYDIRPLLTIGEKREILERAIEEDWILVFEHDAEIAAATVREAAKGPEIREVPDWD